MALWSMGPRQMIAWSWRSRKNSIETALTPPSATSGRILRSPETRGLPCTPSIRGIEYPHTSASMAAAALPSAVRAAARLAVTVDLPTPPLPDPTQTTFLTRASAPVGSPPLRPSCCWRPCSWSAGASATGATATGADATGASALGLVVVGAFALGAATAGAIGLGRLTVDRGRFKKLRIDELEVGRLRVADLEVERRTDPSGPV